MWVDRLKVFCYPLSLLVVSSFLPILVLSLVSKVEYQAVKGQVREEAMHVNLQEELRRSEADILNDDWGCPREVAESIIEHEMRWLPNALKTERERVLQARYVTEDDLRVIDQILGQWETASFVERSTVFHCLEDITDWDGTEEEDYDLDFPDY